MNQDLSRRCIWIQESNNSGGSNSSESLLSERENRRRVTAVQKILKVRPSQTRKKKKRRIDRLIKLNMWIRVCYRKSTFLKARWKQRAYWAPRFGASSKSCWMIWTTKMFFGRPIPYLTVCSSRSVNTLDSVRKRLRAVLIENQPWQQSNGKLVMNEISCYHWISFV